MIAEVARDSYTPTIGIECHVQLKTMTKLFAAVSNDARDAAPNTLVSHICLGMPGALPVLNSKAVDYAMRVAFGLNTMPQKYSYFERKHYFYPDLPKGYQISQLAQPIIVGGEVIFELDGHQKSVRVNRVQLEEDAGKNTHPEGKNYSLVDLNRAGTPLLEIVSEPDIHSPAEARAYARELWLLMRYTCVSDADMYHGNMRFDVNVSISKDRGTLGLRTETKNLNSFRAVEKACEYEIKRQIELLEKGEKIIQETRGWDDAKQKTFSQRSKEEAHDYRYMPDPDIPPVMLNDLMIEAVQKTMPILPIEWRKRLAGLGVDPLVTETLIDAQAEVPDAGYLPFVEESLSDHAFAKFSVNSIVNTIEPLRKEKGTSDIIWNTYIREIYDLQQSGKLSSTNAKALLITLLGSGAEPKELAKYAEEQGFIQVSDEGEISKIVSEVVKENPKAAEDVKNGEMKAIGFLVGQVMKRSMGKANPTLAQELIKKHLGV